MTTIGPFNIGPGTLNGTLGSVLNGVGLLLSNRVDVVQVIDQDNQTQVFGDARPLRAFVRSMSQVMNYPLETGAMASDHIVTMPFEVEIQFLLSQRFYSNVYLQMLNSQREATLFTVQTRTGAYRNMIIQAMPHEERSDVFDAVVLTLQFRQVQFGQNNVIQGVDAPPDFQPADPVQLPTLPRGIQQAVTLPASLGSFINAFSLRGL